MRKTASQAITIQYTGSLTLSSTPRSGYIGTTFLFAGNFAANGNPLINREILFFVNGYQLQDGDGYIVTATTDSFGDYKVNWVANTPGTLIIHTEADYNGLVRSPNVSITIKELLDCSLSVDNATPKQDEQITFTLAMNSGFLNYSWELDFGDGSTKETGTGTTDPYSTIRTHSYGSPGTYTAVLTVTDALGATIAIGTMVLQVFQPILDWWNNRTTAEKILVGVSAISGVVVLIVQKLRR